MSPLEEAAEQLLYDGPAGETLHQTAANLVDEFIIEAFEAEAGAEAFRKPIPSE